MKIKTRLLLLLVPSILTTLLLLISIGFFNANKQAEGFANAEAGRIAFEQSSLIFDKLLQAEAVVTSLVSTMNVMRTNEHSDREDMNVALQGAAASSRGFFGIWVLWEANAFDGRDEDFVGDERLGNEEGRANSYWLWSGDELVFEISENYDHEPYYVQPREKGRLTIIPPYRDMDRASVCTNSWASARPLWRR